MPRAAAAVWDDRAMPAARPIAAAVLGGLLLAGPVAGQAGAAARCAGSGAERLSCEPVAERPQWRREALGPRTALVYPRSVEAVGGRSRHLDGVRAPGGGAAVIAGSRTGERVALIDLGRDVGGYVEVGVRSATGAPLRLGYAESRRDGQTLGDAPALRGALERSDTLPAGRAGRWRSPAIRGAQRYVVLSTAGAGRAVIDYVRVRLTQYRPRTADYAGRFLSSDRVLNRVWWAGAYTWSLATAPAGRGLVSVDGAKRDRLVWSGDLAVANLTAFATTARARAIARDSLLAIACAQHPDGYLPPAVEPRAPCRLRDLERPPRVPPDALGSDAPRLGAYVPLFVSAVARYRQATGDDAFARALLPVLRRGLAWFAARAPDGLYRALGEGLEINWHPFDRADGEDAFTNACWYGALRDMAALEAELGAGRGVAGAYERAAGAVRSALLARLYDPAAGAFRVSTAQASPGHAQDATAYAVLSGLLRGRDARRALAFLAGRMGSRFGTLTTDARANPWMTRQISPFIGSFEALARFAARDGRGAVRLIRRLFGHMALADPGGVLWERMGADGRPPPYGATGGPVPPGPPGQTSLAHGWSTGATYALSSRVLGIAPGARESWSVAPQTSGLRWAQGSMLVPGGRVLSRWALDRRGLRLTVRGPRGHPGEVAVPLGDAARSVAMDGRVIWDGRRATAGASAAKRGDAVVVSGVAGGAAHTLAWAPARRSGPRSRR